MSDARDPYVYSGSNVLINKFNIKNQEKLDDLELGCFVVALKNGIPEGNFDLNHLKNIHKSLLGDLYPWAGEIRSVNIAKPSGTFCASNFIEPELNKLFNKLSKDNLLENIEDKNMFIEKFAYYLGEVNAIHPFREGNGRTTRVFFQELAVHNGYYLDFSKVSKNEYIHAAMTSHNLADNYFLEKVLSKALVQPELQLSKSQLQQIATDSLTKSEVHSNDGISLGL